MEEGSGVVFLKARRGKVVGNDVKLLSFRVAVRKCRMKTMGEWKGGGWKGGRVRFPEHPLKNKEKEVFLFLLSSLPIHTKLNFPIIPTTPTETLFPLPSLFPSHNNPPIITPYEQAIDCVGVMCYNNPNNPPCSNSCQFRPWGSPSKPTSSG